MEPGNTEKDSAIGENTSNSEQAPSPSTPEPTTIGPAPTPPTTPAESPKQRGPKKPLIIAIIIGIVLLGVALVWILMAKSAPKKAATPPQTGASDTGTLRVGTIIDENGVDADKKEFTPFIDYMVSQLHDKGITKGEFVPETSVSEMAKLMREDKVDIYVDSIFPVFVADRLAGSHIIANRWKEGVEKYHTAIFVKKDSPIKTAADLKGKIVAFDSSTSTVGYFLPKAELTKQGYTLTEKQTTTAAVAPGEIGYTFVHDKIFDDVANGVTPAGAESEQEIRDHFGATFDQQYRIIMTTPDVLRFLVTGRKDLDPSLTASIKNTLLAMDKTDAGKTVLEQFSSTLKFSDVGNDSDATYGEIQKLTDQVEEEIVRGGVGASQ